MGISNSQFNQKTLMLILVSFLSYLSWNYYGILFILCIIIFFIYSDQIKKNSNISKLFNFFIFYLFFNVSVTFWLYNLSFDKLIYINLFSSIVMAMSTLPFIYTNNKFIYIISWVFVEILLTKWDLAWPWLIFGNVFGNQWYLVNWYSVTGVYGGTLWILIISYFLYLLIVGNNNRFKNLCIVLILLTFPIYSIINYNSIIRVNETVNVLNYVPNNKYSGYVKTKNIATYLMESEIKHDFVITPELFYSNNSVLNFNSEIYRSILKSIFDLNPKIKLVFGSEHRMGNNIYNGTTVILKDSIYFKSKKRYVPITEYTNPYLEFIYGNTYYNKLSNDNSELIKFEIKTMPFLCYEILFSDFVAKNTYNSNFIILSSSEEFMNGSTIGKNQYLNFIRLRAIENNKFLIKSSNDGISCVINPHGKIIKFLNDKEFNSTEMHLMNNNSTYCKIINFIYNFF